MKSAELYRYPVAQRIPRTAASGKLYRLEDSHKMAFEEAARELGRYLDFPADSFWTHALPEAILCFLDAWDQTAVALAVMSWLEHGGSAVVAGVKAGRQSKGVKP